MDGSDTTMGDPEDPKFWRRFTTKFANEHNLNLVITQDIVTSCMKYAQSLEKLHIRRHFPYESLKAEIRWA